MKSYTRRGALVGVVGGSVLAVGLLARAMMLSPPGGEGERLMWYLTYAAILGAPVSLMIAPICMFLVSSTGLRFVAYALLTLSVPANWALLGAGIGFVVDRWRGIHSHVPPQGTPE